MLWHVMEDKREETILDKMAKVHPNFLEALRATYPLAFLGSLSVVIAAFLRDGATGVQEYAIAAGVAFLLAFLFSVILKFFPHMSMMALLSYTSFGLGIVLLFLVSWEFARAFSLSQVVVGLTILSYIVVFLSIGFWNWSTMVRQEWLRKLWKERKYVAAVLTIFAVTGSLGFLLVIMFFVASGYSTFSKAEIPVNVQGLFGWGTFLLILSAATMTIVGHVLRLEIWLKKRRT